MEASKEGNACCVWGHCSSPSTEPHLSGGFNFLPEMLPGLWGNRIDEGKWGQGREEKELRLGGKSLPANCCSQTTGRNTGSILQCFTVYKTLLYPFLILHRPVRSDFFSYKLDTFSILRAFLES